MTHEYLSRLSLLNPAQFACKNCHFCCERAALCLRASAHMPEIESAAGGQSAGQVKFMSRCSLGAICFTRPHTANSVIKLQQRTWLVPPPPPSALLQPNPFSRAAESLSSLHRSPTHTHAQIELIVYGTEKSNRHCGCVCPDRMQRSYTCFV